MKRSCLSLLAAVLLLCGPVLKAAEPWQHELLVFGSGEVAGLSGADPPTDIDDVRIAADILFSLQRGHLKLFGEYLLANHEQDLERFQVGWEPSEHSVFWAGRFHQASSVWNHQHHHGQFLQTSISRPAAEEWEDEGGIIPQHFVGILNESNWQVGKHGGMHMALGGGLAPVLTPEGLEALDLVKFDSGPHDLGFQARVAWLPDEVEDSSYGLLFAHNEIAWRAPRDTPPPGFDHVDQTVLGVYASVDSGNWKLHAAAYRVETRFEGGVDPESTDDFLTGYVQIERALPHGIEAFARYEDSADTGDSQYLEYFPNFAKRRGSLGARWQFARKHALSFQASSTESMSDNYLDFRLQWSAALL